MEETPSSRPDLHALVPARAPVGFLSAAMGGLARAFGCPARRVEDHAELVAALDELVPGVAAREAPLVLEVAVQPDPTFDP